MGDGPCSQVPRWKAWREQAGCQVRPVRLLKEDLAEFFSEEEFI